MGRRDPMAGAARGHAGRCRKMGVFGRSLMRKRVSLNNNRNTNRRRGRSNRPQGGGGNQMNRIDSRARGNAPQMLDKYKKLAQDAQHNGDRVQAEYYLQFADHYFRVISDNKVRQDEQRGKRPEDRDRDANNDDDGDEDDFDHRSQQPQRVARNPRNRNPRDDNRDGGRERGDNRDDGRERGDDRSSASDDGSEGSEFEPAENPFVRDNRDRDGESRRGRNRRDDGDGDGGEIDAAALPTSISEGEGEKPKPKRKPAARRRKGGEDGEALKAVG